MWLSHSQDSTGSSHHPSSYAQESQCSDFSQINTQDIFSQNSSGTQNEIPQQKKMSMYEKWLSKRTLFKKDSTTDLRPHICKDSRDIVRATSSANNPSGIMEMTSLIAPLNPSFGPDRSILEQVKIAFHDSFKEINSTLDVFKQKLDTSTESSHEMLTQTVNKFMQDIWKQQEQFYNLFNQHSKNMPSSEELQKVIYVHERKITLLEDLLSSRQNESENLSKIIQDFISSQQLKTDQKLEELLKWLKLTNEKHEHSMDDYKKSLEKTLKEFKNENSKRISHSEQRDKKVMSEISDVKEKMEKKFSDLNTKWVEELQVLLKKQTNIISDTNKQFFKQFNQNIYPLKNLRSQNNELVIEQCQAMVTNLEKNIKSHLISNDWNISSMQKSITASIHQTISMLLKQSQDNCIIQMMQQIENKFLIHLSHLEQDRMSKCKIKSSHFINLNKSPEKQITQNSPCSFTDDGGKEKQVKKFHSPVQDALSNRLIGITTSKTEINMEKKTTNDQFQENDVAKLHRKYSKSDVDNYMNDIKIDSVYCEDNKNMKRKSRNNAESSSVESISSSNNYLHKNKMYESNPKSNNRKRKYGENAKEHQFDKNIGMQLNPENLSTYEDKNNCAALGCTVNKKNYKFQDKNPSSFETIDNVYNRRIESQPQKKLWCENIEKKSFFQQKTIQSSFKVHDISTNHHELANNFKNFSSKKVSSMGIYSSQCSRKKGNITEVSSCSSSPTVSITKVTIKKIRTPSQKRLIQGRQTSNKQGLNASPAPTMLSDIDF
ncbi:hypothetical protein Btru_037983 [Bulinus truncatus]|nr:hypothetical protein Btru_037983 [Bulinus truncatus]